jgi:AcrR family transcriptional regulator
VKTKKVAGASRKEAIIAAGVELFAERGFHATSTSEVAALAGVSEGIIFYYFKNKEGILVELLNRVFGEYLEGLARESAGAVTGMEALERMIGVHFGMIRDKAKLIMLLVRDFPASLATGTSPHSQAMNAKVAQVSEAFAQALRRGQQDGSICACPVPETTHILRSLLNGATRMNLLGLARGQDFSGECLEFCRRALAPAARAGQAA